MAVTPPPKLEPIPLPPLPTGPKQWGRKAEAVLVRFALTVWNAVASPYWAIKEKSNDYFFERLADDLRAFADPWLDRLEQTPGIPPEMKDTIKRLRGTPAIPLAALAIGIVISAITGLILGTIAPYQRLASQATDSIARSARLDPPAAFAAWKRGAISEDVFLRCCKEHGWPDDAIAAFSEIFAQRVGVGDLSLLMLREKMSASEFEAELLKRGYKQEEIARIKELQKVIPPLADIIRMSVREAFTPEIVSRFQLHAELPGEMVAWAKKQGLSEDWARAYWASHWELPSLTMGFEMLHRGEISESDMELLIRTHDVSPFWRDKLLAISYSPYTRVDVRRMYESGVLGVEDVLRSYMDIGYDLEKATKMTEFTVALSNSAERDLTKAEVLTGFKIGFFTREETESQLLALGYDQTEAEYYVSKILYDLWQAEIKEQVKYVSQQYIANQIDEATAYGELGKLNLPAEQVNRYIREWDVKRRAKTKTLPAVTLVKFYEAGVITADEFANEMSGIGYSNKYIEWYLNSMAQE